MSCCGKIIRPTLVAPKPGHHAEPPCLECVEKHLGVAEALLEEVADGYRGRLKAIGNLRLAEEHASQWPEIRQAIRTARKQYQLRGTVPEWDVLEHMIFELHEQGAN